MGSAPELQTEQVVVLVKALPHAGAKHGETVCCAGVTLQGEWRRQFPIHFRRLSDKFKRWDLIEYDYILPKDDRRKESRRVQEDTIKITGTVPSKERSRLLQKVIVSSTKLAAERGQSLALIRPQKLKFTPVQKTNAELEDERKAYQEAARQQSFFDEELSALEPCKMAFKFSYTDEDGAAHNSTCDDWETAAMYRKFADLYGEDKALADMRKTFELDYPSKGMAFAMGTHSRYPDVWLLVGILRLDEDSGQTSLL